MKITETALPGVLLIEPKIFGDQRGFFLETYRQDVMHDAGLGVNFIQDNHSRSSKGVLRGLHYQLTQPQGKLVRVTRGEIFDVAVDVRRDSPNFGQWFGAKLSDENMHMMYIPPSFAHGFVVLSDTVDFIYKCTDYYHPDSEQGILWNDPEIGIEWPIQDVNLSEKDQCNPRLSQQDNLPHYSQGKS
jgi:dTDP-4-dehydrorhamnose 3,5-epimerase